MINNNRIVPVTKTDLISLYGLILKQNSSYGSLAKLASLDKIGRASCRERVCLSV